MAANYGNDGPSLERIRADRVIADSQNWCLGKWIGGEESKPVWLKRREIEEELAKNASLELRRNVMLELSQLLGKLLPKL